MYTYKVGMYGGSFDPLHIGHINTIIKAATECEELHLILSYSILRDRINYKQRYQWLVTATKHLPNIVIHTIEDKCRDKDNYDWKTGAEDIKRAIGKQIDVVYCGADYATPKKRFEGLYPGSRVEYTSRYIINISSTKIHHNPYKYWEYIPTFVRPYYTKKVLIIGGESTGKSTLTTNLALKFNTTYLSEVGRDICERAQSEEMMLEGDLLEILVRHKAAELDKLSQANKLLFIDTDCLTTLFYHNLLYPNSAKSESYRAIASGLNALNHYDLVLFLEPDTEFIQDGTRNEAIKANRYKYSNQLKAIFKANNIQYTEISGTYYDRLVTASTLVKALLEGELI